MSGVKTIDDLKVAYATGLSLDVLATVRQIFRRYGETDEELRDRVPGEQVVRTVEEE